MTRYGISIGLILLLMSVGSADQIVQTRSFTNDIGDVNLTFTYDQFDTMGGARTLESIEIIVSLSAVGGERTVDNDDSSNGSGTVEIGVTGGISSTDVSLTNLTAQQIANNIEASTTSGMLSVGPDDGDTEAGGTSEVSVVGPDAVTYNAGTATDSDSGFVMPASWASGNKGYLGTGTFDIEVDYVAFTEFLGFGGIQDAGEPPTNDGEVTVIYNYVPEPATLGLLGVGGLIALLKPRKRK